MLNNKGEFEFTGGKQDWNAAAKAVESVLVFRELMMNWLPAKTSLVIIAVIGANLQHLLFVVKNLGQLAA